MRLHDHQKHEVGIAFEFLQGVAWLAQEDVNYVVNGCHCLVVGIMAVVSMQCGDD
jgi:hypothetical protein